MAETQSPGNLAYIEKVDHAEEIERITGSPDMSYAVALSYGRAELAMGSSSGVAELATVDDEHVEILNEHGWNRIYFRAESVTCDVAMIERFAIAHGKSLERAGDDLGEFTGFSADLKLAKPLASLEVSGIVEDLPKGAKKKVNTRLNDEYGVGEGADLSWTPFPTLLAQLTGDGSEAKLVVCSAGTDMDDYLRDDPEVKNPNQAIALRGITEAEHAAISGLYRALSAEGRELLRHPTEADATAAVS